MSFEGRWIHASRAERSFELCALVKALTARRELQTSKKQVEASGRVRFGFRSRRRWWLSRSEIARTQTGVWRWLYWLGL